MSNTTQLWDSERVAIEYAAVALWSQIRAAPNGSLLDSDRWVGRIADLIQESGDRWRTHMDAQDAETAELRDTLARVRKELRDLRRAVKPIPEGFLAIAARIEPLDWGKLVRHFGTRPD